MQNQGNLDTRSTPRPLQTKKSEANLQSNQRYEPRSEIAVGISGIFNAWLFWVWYATTCTRGSIGHVRTPACTLAAEVVILLCATETMPPRRSRAFHANIVRAQ